MVPRDLPGPEAPPSHSGFFFAGSRNPPAKARHVAVMLAAFCWVTCAAQAPETAGEQPGSQRAKLEKRQASGTVALGYRASSTPFSSRSSPDEPIGFSIDLCRAIVTAMGKKVGHDLAIEWVLVTSATRVKAVVDHDVDLECGSTTNNSERREFVAFSPTMYIAATKMLVKKGKFRSAKALADKRIAVTRGTTTVGAVRDP